jgi:hypothetical protein
MERVNGVVLLTWRGEQQQKPEQHHRNMNSIFGTPTANTNNGLPSNSTAQSTRSGNVPVVSRASSQNILATAEQQQQNSNNRTATTEQQQQNSNNRAATSTPTPTANTNSGTPTQNSNSGTAVLVC